MLLCRDVSKLSIILTLVPLHDDGWPQHLRQRTMPSWNPIGSRNIVVVAVAVVGAAPSWPGAVELASGLRDES